MALNEFLLEVIKRRNVPVYELAILARVNEFLLYKMLRGEHKFTSSMLERIALVLKIKRATVEAVKLLDEVEHSTLREAVRILENPNWLFADNLSNIDSEEEEDQSKNNDLSKQEGIALQMMLRKNGERKAYHRLKRSRSQPRVIK